MIDWRQKYIDMIIKYDDNICSKCMHDYQKICKGSKECDGYVEGSEGFIGDKKVRYPWTCLDFDIGDCSVLQDTPCHGCVDENSKNYFSHFELNEAIISDGE